MAKAKGERPEVLDGGPLHYAPENELGVVFLFAHLAKKWRLRIDKIRPGFPDCIAFQKAQGRENRIRIEFELRSRNFRSHQHNPRKCDWLVCWEHNWPDAPQCLRIVELRREFGLGFNVWIVPFHDPYKQGLREGLGRDTFWSVPGQAHKGDLILAYFTRPEMLIEQVLTLKERASKRGAQWKAGEDYMAPLRKVCALKAPIFLEDLRRDRILATARFVRCGMQGRHNATDYWPYLYNLIVKRNPKAKWSLARFASDFLA